MAGASMKDIKLRIRSVESTKQITKAMELVATSKLRRAKERMLSSKPYGEISAEAIEALATGCKDTGNPYVTARELKRRCYVIIAGERGLAGGYNNNIFKAVAGHCQNVPYCVLPLGRKAVEKYQRMGVELLSSDYGHIEGLGVGKCFPLSKLLLDGYLTGAFDEICLVYTRFVSMLTQEPIIESLLPLPVKEEGTVSNAFMLYECSPEEALNSIVPDFLAGKLYGALCEAFISEVASRRSAMDSANKNADSMIHDLTLRYNRARQGAITQEITEIVAGAEQ